MEVSVHVETAAGGRDCGLRDASGPDAKFDRPSHIACDLAAYAASFTARSVGAAQSRQTQGMIRLSPLASLISHAPITLAHCNYPATYTDTPFLLLLLLPPPL